MNEPLLAAAQTLADLLGLENAALAALDLPRAAAMLDAKQRAVAAVVAAQTGQIDGGYRESAERLARSLQALAQQNRTLLERAIAAQGRVIGVIARAMPRAAAAPRYGASGALAYAGRPSAFALSARA